MGADRWFQAHRFLMVAAVIFTIRICACVGVHQGLALYDMDFIRNNPLHPVIGLVTNYPGPYSSIMALMRPQPGNENPACFNWVHWFWATRHII